MVLTRSRSKKHTKTTAATINTTVQTQQDETIAVEYEEEKALENQKLVASLVDWNSYDAVMGKLFYQKFGRTLEQKLKEFEQNKKELKEIVRQACGNNKALLTPKKAKPVAALREQIDRIRALHFESDEDMVDETNGTIPAEIPQMPPAGQEEQISKQQQTIPQLDATDDNLIGNKDNVHHIVQQPIFDLGEPNKSAASDDHTATADKGTPEKQMINATFTKQTKPKDVRQKDERQPQKIHNEQPREDGMVVVENEVMQPVHEMEGAKGMVGNSKRTPGKKNLNTTYQKKAKLKEINEKTAQAQKIREEQLKEKAERAKREHEERRKRVEQNKKQQEQERLAQEAHARQQEALVKEFVAEQRKQQQANMPASPFRPMPSKFMRHGTPNMQASPFHPPPSKFPRTFTPKTPTTAKKGNQQGATSTQKQPTASKTWHQQTKEKEGNGKCIAGTWNEKIVPIPLQLEEEHVRETPPPNASTKPTPGSKKDYVLHGKPNQENHPPMLQTPPVSPILPDDNVDGSELEEVSAYDLTVEKVFLPSTKDNYNVDDLSSGDETDNDEQPRKTVPTWAQKENIVRRINAIRHLVVAEKIEYHFGRIRQPTVQDFFKGYKKNYPQRRPSSATWNSPMSDPTPGIGRYQNQFQSPP